MKKTKTKNTGKTAMKIGAGLVAAGAAAMAGYYFYGSKDAKKHRKIAAKWATDMKKEVMKEARGLEKISPKAFATIVDGVAKTYQNARSVNAADVRRAANELKKNLATIKLEMKRPASKRRSRPTAAKKRAK